MKQVPCRQRMESVMAKSAKRTAWHVDVPREESPPRRGIQVSHVATARNQASASRGPALNRFLVPAVCLAVRRGCKSRGHCRPGAPHWFQHAGSNALTSLRLPLTRLAYINHQSSPSDDPLSSPIARLRVASGKLELGVQQIHLPVYYSSATWGSRWMADLSV